jgi:hypothetical protein
LRETSFVLRINFPQSSKGASGKSKEELLSLLNLNQPEVLKIETSNIRKINNSLFRFSKLKLF